MIVRCLACGTYNRLKDEAKANAVCGKCKTVLVVPLIQDADETIFQDLVQNLDHPVLVDFWASWCQPCKMMGPILKEFAERYPWIRVAKVDIDLNQKLASQYHIMSVPTLLVFEGGRVQKQLSGVLSLAELEQHLNPWLRSYQ